MELSEELGKEMKKAERENHKTDLEHQIEDLGREINRAGHEVSEEIKKSLDAGTSPSPDNPAE